MPKGIYRRSKPESKPLEELDETETDSDDGEEEETKSKPTSNVSQLPQVTATGKKLTADQKRALFDEYSEAVDEFEELQKGIEELQRALEMCNDRVSLAIQEIAEQIGPGPFGYRGKSLTPTRRKIHKSNPARYRYSFIEFDTRLEQID